jgi:hypothetical protein
MDQMRAMGFTPQQAQHWLGAVAQGDVQAAVDLALANPGWVPPPPEPEPQGAASSAAPHALPLCAFCQSRPRNRGHPYCGRTCAQNAGQAGWQNGVPPPTTSQPQIPAPAPATLPLCAFCGRQPRNGRHPYCGRPCAQQAMNAGWQNGRPPPSQQQPARPAPAPAPTPTPTPFPPPSSSPALTAPNYRSRGGYAWTRGSFVGEFCDCCELAPVLFRRRLPSFPAWQCSCTVVLVVCDETDLEGGQSAPALVDLANYIGEALADERQTPLLQSHAAAVQWVIAQLQGAADIDGGKPTSFTDATHFRQRLQSLG